MSKVALGVLAVGTIAWFGGSTYWYDCKVKQVCDGKMPNPVGAVVAGTGDLVGGAADLAKNAASGAGNIASSAANGAADLAKNAANGAGNIASSAANGAADLAKNAASGASNIVASPNTQPATTAQSAPNTQSLLVYFNTAVSQPKLNAAQKAQLKALIAEAKASKQTIIITGHADTQGSAEINQKISEKRAKALAKLFTQAGADRDILRIAGRSNTQLVNTANTPEAHKENRRAEAVLMP